MIRSFLILLLLCISIAVMGQVPELVSYQAVVRDDQGNLVTNTNILVRVSIVDSLTSTLVYSENHKPRTNQYGLFTLLLGNGSAITGTFAGIDWSVGDFWIHLAINIDGGNYVNLPPTNWWLYPMPCMQKTC